jgi:hypothetical protein
MTTNRTYRYLGRKANGETCCQSDDLAMLCNECRGSVVPAARRLSAALKKTADAPAPRGTNAHGAPVPARLADAVVARGGRR